METYKYRGYTIEIASFHNIPQNRTLYEFRILHRGKQKLRAAGSTTKELAKRRAQISVDAEIKYQTTEKDIEP